MQLPDQLSIGLKEWAVVCDALANGRQILLLRKGGISETGGEFEIEHRQFLLFSTYLHQDPGMVKPDYRDRVTPQSAEPNQITLSTVASVTDILQLGWRQQMETIDEKHIWMPPLIDMRFNYRPDRPLYLMLLRAYRLPQAITIENTPAYWGCKSWVPLTDSIDVRSAEAVLDEEQFESQRAQILQRVQ